MQNIQYLIMSRWLVLFVFFVQPNHIVDSVYCAVGLTFLFLLLHR